MKLSGTITTQCTCNEEEMNDPNEPYACYGECWEFAVEDFAQVVEPLLEKSNHFRVDGIRLWDRTIGGVAKCDNALQLIRAMSVDSDFILRWEFDDETLELGAALSHHDGSGYVTVKPVDEPEDY